MLTNITPAPSAPATLKNSSQVHFRTFHTLVSEQAFAHAALKDTIPAPLLTTSLLSG